MSGPAGEPGERPITVIVDPGNLVKELNEGNNERTRYFVVQAQEGWCCYNNEVFQYHEAPCLEKGGRFFGTQEEAEDFCRAASMPPTITITAPKESETWVAGSIHEIRWETKGAGIAHVSLGYSPDGGTTWVVIAEREPNDGTCEWQLPATLSGDCLLGATIHDSAGELVAYQDRAIPIFIQPQLLPKPDLIITDVWNEKGTICYQIRNVGDAAAAGGHYTGLLIDGNHAVSGRVNTDLQPGERWKGCFDYRWKCSPREDNLVVWADYEDGISESDETNNRREENWKCDTAPPGIISGPTVLDITQNSAVITWKTDEDSDSVVKYGKKAELYASEETYSVQVTYPGVYIEELPIGEHTIEGVTTSSLPPPLENGGITVPAKSHSIMLVGLEPSTTYHFSVQSGDASGNTVESKDSIFETLALLDDIAPTISLIDPGVCRGTVTFSADVDDDTGVEKVKFYLDNKPVFTDYSPPYEFTTDTAPYIDGKHDLKGKVFDVSGNSSKDDRVVDMDNLGKASGLTVKIIKPKDDDSVSGKVEVKAELEDDKGIFSVDFCVDGEWWESEDFHQSPPQSKEVTFIWNTEAKAAGTELVEDGWHQIAVEAKDTEGHKLARFIKVYVANKKASPPPSPGYPYLEVINHTVSRNGNRFTITLTVKNTGDATATNIKILDMLQGFQPIEDKPPTFQPIKPTGSYSTFFNPEAKWGYCEISCLPILPGEEKTYTFHAVPVLIYPNPPAPEIGSRIDISWTNPEFATCVNPDTKHKVETTKEGEPLAEAHKQAVKSCDYLIMTDIYRLFASFNPSYGVGPASGAVNSLLSAMAELAWHKKGVLGDFDAQEVKAANNSAKYQLLRKLVSPGGGWAKKLAPEFSKGLGGYFLIVGEAGIIPSWTEHNWDMEWDDGTTTTTVYYSDQRWADTVGNDFVPELVMGRIIGDDPQALTTAIRNSIGAYEGWNGYGYDHSHALCYSGTGKASSKMVASADSVAIILSGKKVNTDKVHAKDLSSGSLAFEAFCKAAPDKDIIYLRGHGFPDLCDEITSDRILNKFKGFGSTNPFIFAASCYTGKYASGDLAENFFLKGAAIYIGATEYSGDEVNSTISEDFFKRLASKFSKPIGWHFTSMEQSYSAPIIGEIYRFWCCEYNLYGDPKFGVPPKKATAALPQETQAQPVSSLDLQHSLHVPPSFGAVVTQATAVLPRETQAERVYSVDSEHNLSSARRFGAVVTQATAAPLQEVEPEPASSLDVVVPDYEVTTVDGVDHVTIPDGAVWLEKDRHQVPFYPISIDYPEGYKVQEVVLTQRSGLVTDTGLNIPITTMEIASEDVATSPGNDQSPSKGGEAWFPEEEYDWEILEHPDGSATLFIVMYPFYYNPLTTDVRFCKNYSFDIDYTVSSVEITSVATDQAVYQQGDRVAIDIGLVNSGEPQDVTVSATVNRYVSDELVDGLPLSKLNGLSGEASLSLQWDSSGFAPGSCYVEVILRDIRGNILDKQTEGFILGITSGEITNLTAKPKHFDIGDNINISLTFNNTGTVDISGTTVVRVQDEAGETVQEFRHDVTDLAPASSTSFDDTWDTSEAAEGRYDIIGFVLYDGGATAPAAVAVSTEGGRFPWLWVGVGMGIAVLLAAGLVLWRRLGRRKTVPCGDDQP